MNFSIMKVSQRAVPCGVLDVGRQNVGDYVGDYRVFCLLGLISADIDFD